MASIPSRDPLFELKAEAIALQAQAKSSSSPLTRSQALEAVARRHGYKDWNAAAAAAKADVLLPPAALIALLDWRDVSTEIPGLPTRIAPARDPRRATLNELMRWAKQLDYIGSKAPEEDRHHLIAHIGGEVPYVFVKDPSRFETELFYLCERSYDEMEGVEFNQEQLELCGAVDWHNQRGSHDGYTMFSVIDDDLRMDGSSLEFRQAARVLVNIALLADHLWVSQK